MPGYTTLDDDVTISDIDMARAEAIASRITQIEREMEQERFRRMDAWENPGEHWEPEFDTDEEQAAWEQRQRGRKAARDLELDWLHEQLSQLNCRMMRPYEHWNEDERYMQYMECDRFTR